MADEAVGGDSEPTDSDLNLFSDESTGGGGSSTPKDDDEDVHDHPIPGIGEKDDADDLEDVDDEDDDDLDDTADSDDEEDEEDEEAEGAPKGKKEKGASEDDDEEKEDEDEDDLLKDKAPTTTVAEKRYAKVWKEHPELRAPYYRDRQFREHFSTPEDAKSAAEKVSFFTGLEMQLDAGDPKGLLETLAQYGQEGTVVRLARNFVPALSQLDSRLETVVAMPLINKFLKSAQAEARRLGLGDKEPGRNLHASVLHLLQFMHPEGKPEFVERKDPPPPQADPEKERLRAEVQTTQQRTAMNFESRVHRSGHRVLDSKITKLVLRAGREHEKESGRKLSRLEMKALAQGAKKRLIRVLDQDQDHNQAMDLAWKEAKRRGYTDDHIPEVTRAFLRGANSLLPRVMKRELQEALGRKKKPGAPKVPGGGAPNRGSREGRGGHKEPIPFSRYDTSRSSNPDLDLFLDKLPLKGKR